jgi:hypothetical protein
VQFNRQRKPDDARSNDNRVPALHAFILAGVQGVRFSRRGCQVRSKNLKQLTATRISQTIG